MDFDDLIFEEERRGFARYAVNCRVGFVGPGGIEEVPVRNIGYGGVCLEMRQAMRQGELIRLILPGATPRKTEGLVRSVSEEAGRFRVGVEFLESEPVEEAVKEILKVSQWNLDDPTAAPAETPLTFKDR